MDPVGDTGRPAAQQDDDGHGSQQEQCDGPQVDRTGGEQERTVSTVPPAAGAAVRKSEQAGALLQRVRGLASAVAAAIGSPERRSSGTVSTLPPTPRNEASEPIGMPSAAGTATASSPAGPSCAGLRKPGRTSTSAGVAAR